MEWLMMSMDRFFAPTLQLGTHMAGDDKFVVPPNCLAKIEDIVNRLNQDKARWHFRRSLFLNKVISKNLLPLLIHVKEDRGLVEAAIKVLQELMTPVECLMPRETMSQNLEGQRIIYELETSITAAKKLFLDTRITKSLVDLMSTVLQESKMLSLEECELINHCLLLVRNLLHVSPMPLRPTPGLRNPPPSTSGTKHEGGSGSSVFTEDQIMWNLFAQRFDNVLIQLLTCDQQHLWNITMVQLVSLMYRDQQQGTIRKLINEWLESSLSESSEDDENNPMSSSSSDAISTSDPVSDSSERLSPVDDLSKGQMNHSHTHLTNSNENSDVSSSANKQDKLHDSCKDSGIGRSGSNMDSSPDESVSDGMNPASSRYSQEATGSSKLSQPWYTQEEAINKEAVTRQSPGMVLEQSSEKVVDMETCLVPRDSPKDTCEMKSVGECDLCDSGQGGQEWGSEGSSPVPCIENENLFPLVDNSRETPMGPFIPREQKDGYEQLLPVMMQEDIKSLPMESRVDEITLQVEQQMCPQEPVKRPPNEEESGSSGDSSEKKPPPQLPKLHKNKPLAGQKRSRHSMSQKMLSDTQENNESSNSTGSECDEGPHAKRPHHQKPHKMLSKPRPAKMLQKALQERNIKRTKLMKRKESNSIKAKALLHHHPTPEDISNLLKEFTVDFMLNGYSNLLQGLRLQVMLPYQIELDKSHLLWLITYFLRFAVELELELSQICPVLSIDVVSYLTYEGVVMQEALEGAVRAGEAVLLPHVRRLHLVITALREFFVAFDVCLKREHSLMDSRHLLKMKVELGELVGVRQLFLMLIRLYRPGVMSLNYLQDLIITNHRFLTTQEPSGASFHMEPKFDIYNHIKQFATMDIMRQYGRLLENFNVNDEYVNDCIFTMMHHIAGDLRNVNVLLQPSILRTFLRIWREGFDLCVDWADLIEYVLRKCARIRIEHPNKKESKDTNKNLSESSGIELTNEDLDQLYNLYTSSTSEQDLMDKIKEICCDDSIEEPIKKEVIQKLLARGFITTSECSKLCAEIPTIEPLAAVKSEGDVSLECDVMQVSSDSEDSMDTSQLALPQPHDPFKLSRKKGLEGTTIAEHHKVHAGLQKNTGPSKMDTSASYPHSVEEKKSEKAESSVEGNTTMTEDSCTDWEDNAALAYIIEKLRECGQGSQVQWVQAQLLEACYAKVSFIQQNAPRAEAVPFHFTFSNQSIPMVPWTGEQEELSASPFFHQLLGELGFHLPADTGKLFPRIPHFWAPDVIYMVAKRLGPIACDSVRVPVEQMLEMVEQLQFLTRSGLDAQNEDRLTIKEASSVGCDDSYERVSDCSMENNRSSPSSPVSSQDEHVEDLQPPTPSEHPSCPHPPSQS